jgi:hypothetical protein
MEGGRRGRRRRGGIVCGDGDGDAENLDGDPTEKKRSRSRNEFDGHKCSVTSKWPITSISTRNANENKLCQSLCFSYLIELRAFWLPRELNLIAPNFESLNFSHPPLCAAGTRQ